MEVKELVAQMTLEEKLRQLTQLNGIFFDESDETAATGPKAEVKIQKEDIPGIGSALNFLGTDQVRTIQKNHMKADRNKIPMLFMMDVVHGCVTQYPIPLAMGATFSPELLKECAAIDAGVKMLMTSFNSLNGVPAAANKKLVKGILRDEWKYNGVVISDYNSFRELMQHGVAEDEKECAYKAISVTNDIEMMSATYLHCVKELIEEGRVSEAQIDEAVMRVLNLKKDLGLFDDPYIHCGKTKEEAEKNYKAEVLSAENRKTAKKAAEKAAVLLKNDGLLPFTGKEKKNRRNRSVRRYGQNQRCMVLLCKRKRRG